MAEKMVEYLVKQKCFYNGAIKEPGDTIVVEEGEKLNPAVFCLRKDYEEPKPAKEFLPQSHGGMMAQAKTELTDREKLEKAAKSYGIKFSKRTTTEELSELVKAAANN